MNRVNWELEVCPHCGGLNLIDHQDKPVLWCGDCERSLADPIKVEVERVSNKRKLSADHLRIMMEIKGLCINSNITKPQAVASIEHIVDREI